MELLAGVLASVNAQDFPKTDYEILVVDNAPSPTPEIEALCPSGHLPVLFYINEPQNGLHHARHAGARAAKGQILLYLDDDAIADKNLLNEIVRIHSDPEVGCVGGKILPQWEAEPPEWTNHFPKWYLSILDDDEGPKEVKWIYGCNFSIKRELLFEAGGFNPDGFGDRKKWLFRGDGEAGLLKKVHDLGKKVVYNPKAVVWHFINKQRLTVDYFKERSFKAGIESEYSRYHYSTKPLNYIKLILILMPVALRYFAMKMSAVIYSRNRIRYDIKASFYKARFIYSWRLLTDNQLKKFLKINRWLAIIFSIFLQNY